MNPFQRLRAIKKDAVIDLEKGGARVVACPDMGARVFVELEGRTPHRIDLEAVARPVQPFNNFGGMNLWPAPEGGAFGFNYEGDRWYVQPAINVEPFTARDRTAGSVLLEKRTVLGNRKGTRLEVAMARRVGFAPPAACLEGCPIAASVAEESGTLMDVVEPYLLQLGFIERTPRGRTATPRAYAHLGYAYSRAQGAEATQTNLFDENSLIAGE